jgi:hypothetical protein
VTLIPATATVAGVGVAVVVGVGVGKRDEKGQLLRVVIIIVAIRIGNPFWTIRYFINLPPQMENHFPMNE